MSEDKIRVRLASSKLVITALELLENGELNSREKIMLALQLDAREDILELKENVDKVNNHPFHRITPKRLVGFVIGFLSISAVYIQESRDAMLSALGNLFATIF